MSKSTPGQPVRRSRAAGAFRAALLLAALVTASLTSFLHAARAQVGEQLSRFGSELMAWREARANGAPRRLFVNGLEIRLTTLSTPLPVHEALGRFHRVCEERGGIERSTWLDGRPALASALPALDGVFSWESDVEGVTACLDTGRPLAIDELLGRTPRFAKTGDLSALGELRYVVARRSGRTTTLLVIWTEGTVPLLRAFPPQGDAPGKDPENVPRPGAGRRVLSAAELGEPYSLTSYVVVGATPEGLSQWYERELTRAGWVVTRGPGALIARQGDRVLTVHCAARSGTGAVATVVALS
jgi:hypothetical protein